MVNSAPEQAHALRVSKLVQDMLAARGLSSVGATQKLSSVGFKSIDMFNLMLAVEEEFDITIPQTEMTIDNFESVSSINRIVEASVASRELQR